jgi:DNA-binding NarL/FixJ family response regulator
MNSSASPILIADKQYLIARSLTALIEENLPYTIKEVVNSRPDLERSLSSGALAMLIIDVNQFEFDRKADLKNTLSLNPSVPVLVLTNSITKEDLTDLNSIGIRNILFKSAAEEELLLAIDMTLHNKKYYGQEVMDILMESGEWKRVTHESTSLTVAEIEIVKLIAEGLTTKEIASKKHVSFHTIMTHRKNIFRKAKVNNASELVMFAIRAGLIDLIEYQI